MVQHMMQVMPPEAVKIVMALLLSFLIGLEREEHKIGPSQYCIRRRAYVPADRACGFCVGGACGQPACSRDRRIRGGRRVSVAFLSAQTAEIGSGRRDDGNLRPRDVSGGRACGAGTVLAGGRAHGHQSSAAGTEDVSGEPVEAASRAGNFHLYEISALERGDPAHRAESSVRPVWIQSLQDMACGGRGECGVVCELSVATADDGEERDSSGGDSGRNVFLDGSDRGVRETCAGRASAASVFGIDSHRVERDVFPSSDIGSAVQYGAHEEAARAVSRSCGDRHGGRVDMDDASGRTRTKL